jgi:hypothetical protein
MQSISTRRTQFLENVLAHFTTPDRAASIHGDLLEMSHGRNSLWFTAAYLRILTASALPHTAAWFGSYAVGCLIMYLASTLWPTWRLEAPKTPVNLFMYSDAMGFFAVLFFLPLSFGTTYLLARFGRQDPLAKFAAALGVVSALPFLLLPFPWVLFLCGACNLILLVGALFIQAYRRALTILAASSATACLTFFVMVLLLKPVDFAGPYYVRFIVVTLTGLPTMLAFTTVATRMHKRLFRTQTQTLLA